MDAHQVKIGDVGTVSLEGNKGAITWERFGVVLVCQWHLGVKGSMDGYAHRKESKFKPRTPPPLHRSRL